MTAYIKLSTLEYPRHEDDIRREHPSITKEQTGEAFPCPDTYALVHESPRPFADFDLQQIAVEIAPQQINGVWTQQWEVQRIPDDVYEEALKMKQNRFPL